MSGQLDMGNDVDAGASPCRPRNGCRAARGQVVKRRHVFAKHEVRDAAIEECARCVPTTWLDSMLSGPDKVAEFDDGAKIELLLQAVARRIRALSSQDGAGK